MTARGDALRDPGDNAIPAGGIHPGNYEETAADPGLLDCQKNNAQGYQTSEHPVQAEAEFQ